MHIYIPVQPVTEVLFFILFTVRTYLLYIYRHNESSVISWIFTLKLIMACLTTLIAPL